MASLQVPGKPSPIEEEKENMMSSRRVPREKSEETTAYGKRTTRSEEGPTDHEERTTSSKGGSRPRLLDAITLVSLGYIIRDRFGPIGKKIGSWTDGPPERVQNIIREQTEEITREAVDQFLNSSQSMAERTEGTTETAADRIEETGEQVGDRIEEGSERVGETIKGGGERAGEKLQQGGEGVSEALGERNEEREPDGEANRALDEGANEADEKHGKRWEGPERKDGGRRGRDR